MAQTVTIPPGRVAGAGRIVGLHAGRPADLQPSSRPAAAPAETTRAAAAAGAARARPAAAAQHPPAGCRPICGPPSRSAVAAARARKRDVVFDVVEITPGTAAGSEAAEIAQIIVAQGVPAARVNLSARPVPDVAREVRVFVH